jgi:hypothetical protein
MGRDEQNSRHATTAAVDDRGTSEAEARDILLSLRDTAFDGSDEKFALALGRPVAEVTGMISGNAAVDDDVVMKARGIAQERGME